MQFCQEVQSFIVACEAIQSILAGGGTLTEDERGVLELMAEELLEKLWKKPEDRAA